MQNAEPKLAQNHSLEMQNYSLEVTAREILGLEEAAKLIAPRTRISIAFLPKESMDARVSAAASIRSHGFVPVPHVAARRLRSHEELRRFFHELSIRAAVDRVLVVAGDLPNPVGPYQDAFGLIQHANLAHHGIRHVEIAGYPEGHPNISESQLLLALQNKLQELERQGLQASIVTQFGFDALPVLTWLQKIRGAGIHAPVRVGAPGPASVRTLLRFAALCGVKASASVMQKYGLSLTKLLGNAGPDAFVEGLQAAFDPAVHGHVSLHFYPFGGLAKTVDWVAAFQKRKMLAPHGPASRIQRTIQSERDL